MLVRGAALTCPLFAQYTMKSTGIQVGIVGDILVQVIPRFSVGHAFDRAVQFLLQLGLCHNNGSFLLFGMFQLMLFVSVSVDCRGIVPIKSKKPNSPDWVLSGNCNLATNDPLLSKVSS